MSKQIFLRWIVEKAQIVSASFFSATRMFLLAIAHSQNHECRDRRLVARGAAESLGAGQGPFRRKKPGSRGIPNRSNRHSLYFACNAPRITSEAGWRFANIAKGTQPKSRGRRARSDGFNKSILFA